MNPDMRADMFIDVPDTLVLGATAADRALPIDQAIQARASKAPRIQDYAIYAELPRAALFSDAMNWKYKIVQDYDASGNSVGMAATGSGTIYDGHDPNGINPLPLTADIINTPSARAYLGASTRATRFAHCKHASQFFRYSFKVGDEVSLSLRSPADGSTLTDGSGNALRRTGQLYAVYLDTASGGAALPYWRTVAVTTASGTASTRQFYFASAAELTVVTGVSGATTTANLLSVVAASGQLVSSLDGSGAAAVSVTVVVPPDPDYPENGAAVLPVSATASGQTVVGGNLAVRTDASGNLVVRPVGVKDASGNWVRRVQYNSASTTASGNFVKYTTESNRALVLYWVVRPLTGTPYAGEEMYVAWSSANLGASASGYVRPLVDFTDASGQITGPPPLSQILEAHRFKVSRDLPGGGTCYNVELSLQNLWQAGAAPRLYLPSSRYIVIHEKSTSATSAAEMSVPFAYEVANMAQFDDARKTVLGCRIMQLVSQYLFGAATARELSAFPFMLNQGRVLTDRVVDGLAAMLRTSSTAMSASRSAILQQIAARYGRRVFDDNVTVNPLTNEATGDVRTVLSKLGADLYLRLTVTVRTTVANRTKARVDVLQLVEVPVVLRAF